MRNPSVAPPLWCCEPAEPDDGVFTPPLPPAEDDRSVLTEQIEPLPKVPTPSRKDPVLQAKQMQKKKPEKQEKPLKAKAKAGRPKGRISTPERKPVRKEPVYVPREEVKKKKGCCACLNARNVTSHRLSVLAPTCLTAHDPPMPFGQNMGSERVHPKVKKNNKKTHLHLARKKREKKEITIQSITAAAAACSFHQETR